MNAKYYYYDTDDFDTLMTALKSQQLYLLTEIKIVSTRSNSANGLGCLELQFEPVHRPAAPSVPPEPTVNDVFWSSVRRALASSDGDLKAQVMKMLVDKGWVTQ